MAQNLNGEDRGYRKKRLRVGRGATAYKQAISKNRPLGVEISHYLYGRKEHIANEEQIGYIGVLQSIPPVRQGRVVGGSNPGHKERIS